MSTTNPTIDDVARLAGVSAMTVSRYLNETGPVAATTADRIQDAIQTLNYIPHRGARALAARKTNTIGLILPVMNDVFFYQLIQGIQATLAQHDVDLLLYAPTDLSRVDVLNLPLGRHNTDGLLIFAGSLEASAIRRLHRTGFPMVQLFHSAETDLDIPAVIFENKRGAYELVSHLIACGHRRIGFLAGEPSNEDAFWRGEGYRAAMADHGLEIDPAWIARADFEEHLAANAVQTWLAEGIALDAIFAADDVSARGAIQAIQAAGLTVPDDIAVGGFDDGLLSQYLDPPLTTVRAPIEAAGRISAETLLHLIQDEPVEREILLPTELIVRASCGSAERHS